MRKGSRELCGTRPRNKIEGLAFSRPEFERKVLDLSKAVGVAKANKQTKYLPIRAPKCAVHTDT